MSFADDIAITQFGGFEKWRLTGNAFDSGALTAQAAAKLGIEGARDDAVISSAANGDGAMGTLTSPDFKVERKYISFLICGGDWERRTCLDLVVDGKVVHSATGRGDKRLTAQSWDVSRLKGKTAHLQVIDKASVDGGHINVDHVVQTDAPEKPPVNVGPLYGETLRPQFHFTARQWTMDRLNPQPRQEGWINDLNGLIYYDGEYHLFAQRWYKCWLHAVSRDLIHWTELQPAFWEEQLESGTQSGTVVVDYDNTAGLSPDKSKPPMVAFWAKADNRNICISYSLDHGRTWTIYKGNPVLVHPERDPKVFWYAPGKHWVMMLYDDGQYHILTSPDLLNWKDEHHPLPNSFECPDFFELPVDGNASNKKWVLIQGNGNYSIGTFDGTEFKEETGRLPCDVGPNFYATQSWANTETGDGRRIQAAWMHGADFPDMPFNQETSFPCELTLHTTPNGLRIFRQPIQEIQKLHDGHRNWKEQVVSPGAPLTLEQSGDTFQIEADVTIPAGSSLIFNLRGIPVTLTSQTLESGGTPTQVGSEVKHVEILLDRGSVEVYINHGELSSTRYALAQAEGLSLTAQGGPVSIRSMTLYKLKSIWPKNP